MSEARYLSWVRSAIAGYAEDKVRAGNWPSEGALERSRKEMDQLLPQGVATPGHLLFDVFDAQRNMIVGQLWIKISDEGTAFIYNIEIDDRQQGRGYGSAALLELERAMAARGVRRISLHVFGFNTRAQALYQKLGYQVTNINMSKML